MNADKKQEHGQKNRNICIIIIIIQAWVENTENQDKVQQ